MASYAYWGLTSYGPFNEICVLFLAAKSSSSRLCNLWYVCVNHPSSHTCPEALIKLSELVNKYLLQFGPRLSI